MTQRPIALTIAGSDSGGGAGIQADLKTFHEFGVFGTTVVVAVTAQNTLGITAISLVPADTVRAQLAALASDLPPQATKSGMLATAELVKTVAHGIQEHAFPNYVLDPVMVATSGDRLLAREAEASMAERLVPLATLVTPNLAEATMLTGEDVQSPAAMLRAGHALLRMGAGAALVKGGHLPTDEIVDLLVTPTDVRRYCRRRRETTSTHGTGCTLSAAVTAGLARGHSLERSVTDALAFVERAIAAAWPIGHGRGPLNHFVGLRP